MSDVTKGGKAYCFDERGNEVPFSQTRRHISLSPDFPLIVCLCGSTKFKQEYIEANFRETMAGRIVLSVGLYSHADAQTYAPTEGEKAVLDELHKRKIDLCDEVLILNCKALTCSSCKRLIPGTTATWMNCTKCCRAEAYMVPYIGSSTRSEIAYATHQGKVIRYLEEPS